MKIRIRLSAFLVFSCVSNAAFSSDDWITEEVLKQLTEIRQELKALKKEVGSLKETIQNSKPVAGGVAATKSKSVVLGNSPRLGSKDAKLGIVEFSDYQCPYCLRHFKETFPKIKENYIDTGKVQYIVKDFPLSFHQQAKPAAVAVHCAGQQVEQSYWQMHELIFSGEIILSTSSFIDSAEELGLDIERFTTCLAEPSISNQIDEDMAAAGVLGVQGTPAFFIGKIVKGNLVDTVMLSGARPYSVFESNLNNLVEN